MWSRRWVTLQTAQSQRSHSAVTARYWQSRQWSTNQWAEHDTPTNQTLTTPHLVMGHSVVIDSDHPSSWWEWSLPSPAPCTVWNPSGSTHRFLSPVVFEETLFELSQHCRCSSDRTKTVNDSICKNAQFCDQIAQNHISQTFFSQFLSVPRVPLKLCSLQLQTSVHNTY